jgi:hypothetical protein
MKRVIPLSERAFLYGSDGSIALRQAALSGST